jgi:hypothetical protein
MNCEAAGGVLTAKQAPHRPGTDPAHGLRAERAAVILPQTTPAKETTMWHPPQHPARRLRVEVLEDRSVPAAFLEADAVGDFLPTYTGVKNPGLDVVSYEAVLVGDDVVFAGEMAGSIAGTQADGGLYIIGVDRGRGTARFATGNPPIGPHVLWDSVVRINPDGTGLFNNIIAPGGAVMTPLGADRITIDGNQFTARVPLSAMQVNADRPPEEWTYNLWPRNSAVIGSTVAVSDLAPDDGNTPVRVIAPARVEGVVVNDGAAQRSMVKSLTVAFDGPVTIDPGAFELTRQGGGPVGLNVAVSEVDGKTVAVLTFSGPGIVGGSLADGNYALAVRGDHVHDRFGRALDGDGNGTAGGDRTDALFRLYGDSDGDRDVDLHDLGRFLSTLGRGEGDPQYLAYFDVNGDARVGVVDLVAFAHRFGTHLDA